MLLTLLLMTAEPAPRPVTIVPIKAAGFTEDDDAGWLTDLRKGLSDRSDVTLVTQGMPSPAGTTRVTATIKRVRTRYELAVHAVNESSGDETVRLEAEVSKQEDISPWLRWAGYRVAEALTAAPLPRTSYLWPVVAGGVAFLGAAVASVCFVNASASYFALQNGETWNPQLAATGRTQLTAAWVATGVGIAGLAAMVAWLFKPFDPPGVSVAFVPGVGGASFAIGGSF